MHNYVNTYFTNYNNFVDSLVQLKFKFGFTLIYETFLKINKNIDKICNHLIILYYL